MEKSTKTFIKKLIDKRKMIVIFSIVFLLLFFISAIIYEHKFSAKNLLRQNISEIQENYFYYNDKQFEISVLNGTREQPYSLDGISKNLTPYFIIIINQIDFKPINTISLFINEENFEFSPTLNPFNNNYVYDLAKEINNVKNVEVKIDENDNIYTLENVTTDFKFDYNNCIDLIHKKFIKLIKSFKNHKDYSAEAFIRIVKVKNFNRFFYEFYLVSQNHTTFDFYIDPITSEIYTN